jgi:hypothetical protein
MSRQIGVSPAPAGAVPDAKAINFIGYVLGPRVLKRNLVIALIVGSLLTLANQYELISRGPMSPMLLVKICFNFVIPFVVSSVSAYANRRDA